MVKINYWKLAISIVICQLAGVIGSVFTVSSVSTWYLTINKPFFNPPGWIFGPVWITLYFLMGISFYLVWSKGFKRKESKIALRLFLMQLILNSIWSILFFGFKSPLFAFIEILILLFTIIMTTIYFNKISKPASYLLWPYILWVSFATLLNFSIWILNS